MTGRPRKVSFVLQFVQEPRGPAGTPVWRGALHEVENGTRHPITRLAHLAEGLAAHGVVLPDGAAAPGGPPPEPTPPDGRETE